MECNKLMLYVIYWYKGCIEYEDSMLKQKEKNETPRRLKD